MFAGTDVDGNPSGNQFHIPQAFCCPDGKAGNCLTQGLKIRDYFAEGT